jgi:adenylate cyclase
MESHGAAGRIQISAATRALLGDGFACDRRGTIEVKGKGEMETYWLEHEGSVTCASPS